MSLRLDPRRLGSLKRLAAEAGLRPGELARQWIEERIDADRPGGAARGVAPTGLDELRRRLDELTARLDALETDGAGRRLKAEAESPVAMPVASQTAPDVAEATPGPRRRGRPRKTASQQTGARRERGVPLHEEIIAVISERGPSTAAEIAQSILERGRYAPPRSGKPLDAAMVNSRVSNPVYRGRFARSDGRIGLAQTDTRS